MQSNVVEKKGSNGERLKERNVLLFLSFPCKAVSWEKKRSNGERLKEKHLFSSYPELPDGRSKEEKHFLAHTKCKRKHCFKMNLLTTPEIFFSR